MSISRKVRCKNSSLMQSLKACTFQIIIEKNAAICVPIHKISIIRIERRIFCFSRFFNNSNVFKMAIKKNKQYGKVFFTI